MKEKIIILNENDYNTKEAILLKIEEELGFVYKSIRNLDALRDSLNEMFKPVTFLIIANKDYICFDYMIDIYNTLEIISKENEYIKVIVI